MAARGSGATGAVPTAAVLAAFTWSPTPAVVSAVHPVKLPLLLLEEPVRATARRAEGAEKHLNRRKKKKKKMIITVLRE